MKLILAFLIFVVLFVAPCFAQGESGYKIGDSGIDFLVDEGLSILGKNEFGMDYGHALSQLGFKAPSYNTEIERFKIAVERFQVAL